MVKRKRVSERPPGQLRDRNTILMVADYWGVSREHVRRLIDTGTLPALRLGGVIRITREQVADCEAACNTKTRLNQEKAIVQTVVARERDPFALGRLIAGQSMNFAPSRSRGDKD